MWANIWLYKNNLAVLYFLDYCSSCLIKLRVLKWSKCKLLVTRDKNRDNFILKCIFIFYNLRLSFNLMHFLVLKNQHFYNSQLHPNGFRLHIHLHSTSRASKLFSFQNFCGIVDPFIWHKITLTNRPSYWPLRNKTLQTVDYFSNMAIEGQVLVLCY